MYSEELNQPEMTITADSLVECKRRLFNEYGDNYTITGKRTVLHGGFLGFGQKEYIEVKYIVRSHAGSQLKQDAASSNPADAFQKNRDELLKSTTGGASVTTTMQMAKLTQTVEEYQKSIDAKLSIIANAASAVEKHPAIKKIEDLLSENEFSFSYINRMSDRIRNEFSLEQLESFDDVQKQVVDWIGEDIKILPKVPVKLPHVIVIVGPTGVGKTTTVAKVAAGMIINAKKNNLPHPEIRMITIDRTRVGAQEQLQKYGEIMNIPVDKAESALDVRKIFETYSDSLDALIIDTSGYSPNDYENIGKMRGMLEVPGMHPDIYLAITASTKSRDLEIIMQNYETFDYKSVIVTKCDESASYGNVLSVLAEKNKPISFITDGQQVPSHINPASVNYFLLHLCDFKIDRMHINDIFPEVK
jgi:flagellar biosynthesis protein FlhF